MTIIFSKVINPQYSANDLNHYLDLINKWSHQWKMSFNPDPAKQATEILFSCKKANVIHPEIFFNGTVVYRVTNQKHLGLIIIIVIGSSELGTC